MSVDDPEPRSIQRLIEDRRHELGGEQGPVSLRELSKRAGGRPAAESWRRIAMGTHQGALSDRLVSGIARALEVPVADVYAAAGVPPALAPWRLPERFDRVPPPERAMFETLVSSWLDAYDKGRQDGMGAR